MNMRRGRIRYRVGSVENNTLFLLVGFPRLQKCAQRVLDHLEGTWYFSSQIRRDSQHTPEAHVLLL